jgi:hypothetical protein
VEHLLAIRRIARAATSETAKERYWRIDEVATIFADFERNFSLKDVGKSNKSGSRPRRSGLKFR